MHPGLNNYATEEGHILVLFSCGHKTSKSNY